MQLDGSGMHCVDIQGKMPLTVPEEHSSHTPANLLSALKSHVRRLQAKEKRRQKSKYTVAYKISLGGDKA
jgi:hypothetical protein